MQILDIANEQMIKNMHNAHAIEAAVMHVRISNISIKVYSIECTLFERLFSFIASNRWYHFK